MLLYGALEVPPLNRNIIQKRPKRPKNDRIGWGGESRRRCVPALVRHAIGLVHRRGQYRCVRNNICWRLCELIGFGAVGW